MYVFCLVCFSILTVKYCCSVYVRAVIIYRVYTLIKTRKDYLPPVNAEPLAAPNVEHATNTGITHAMTPYS